MATVVISDFGGLNLKANPFLLGLNGATIARNVDFSTGKGTPFRAPELLLLAAEETKGIAFFNGGIIPLPFFAEKTTVGLARGGRLAQLLLTGDGVAPQVIADNSNTRYRLGAPHTVNKPTGVISGTDGGNQRLNVFVVTVAMDDGSEGVLSEAYEARLGEGQSVTISASFPSAPDETYLDNEYRERYPSPAPLPSKIAAAPPSKIFLYRAINADLVRVGTRDWNGGAAVTFPPIAYNSNAGSSIQAQFVGQETRPRLDLRGIAVHPKGFAFGYAGNILCFSAVNQFGIWPRSYEVEIPEGEILAAIEFSSDIYIYPAGHSPVIVRLVSPDNLELTRYETSYILEKEHARAVVNMGRNGVWCPVREGIMRLPGGDLITESIFSERGAKPFIPPPYAFAVADEYFGARAADALYLTLRGAQPGFIRAGDLDVNGPGSGALIDTARGSAGTYCLHSGGGITLWAAGEPLTMEWQSGKIRLNDKNTLPVAWVFGGGVEGGGISLHNDWLATFADPILLAGELVQPNSVILTSAASSDEITMTVITENGKETLTLPSASTSRADFNADNCDCDAWLESLSVTGFVQLGIKSSREIIAFGVHGNYDELLSTKNQVGVFPASGYAQ